MKKLLKKETGVTLIALIISIIVMLILAGVTISILTGDNSIIQKAELAAIENKAAHIEENKFMWQMERLMAQQEGNPVKSLDEFLQELKEEGVLTEEEVNTIKASENKEITIGSRTISFNVENEQEETPKITLSATSGEVEAESTLILTATLNVTAEENIVWTSSDNNIATVVGSGTNNSTGTITGLKAGTVTITATYGTEKQSCTVEIKEKTVREITFTVKDYGTFTAIEGWDWETWCSDLNYNTGGFYIDGNIVRNINTNNTLAVSGVRKNSIIVSGGYYEIPTNVHVGGSVD